MYGLNQKCQCVHISPTIPHTQVFAHSAALYEHHKFPIICRIRFLIYALLFKSIYGLVLSFFSYMIKVKQKS